MYNLALPYAAINIFVSSRYQQSFLLLLKGLFDYIKIVNEKIVEQIIKEKRLN